MIGWVVAALIDQCGFSVGRYRRHLAGLAVARGRRDGPMGSSEGGRRPAQECGEGENTKPSCGLVSRPALLRALAYFAPTDLSDEAEHHAQTTQCRGHFQVAVVATQHFWPVAPSKGDQHRTYQEGERSGRKHLYAIPSLHRRAQRHSETDRQHDQ